MYEKREGICIPYKKMEGFAVVTGSARGLGAAMAEQLAREGYDLVINYTSDKSTPIAEKLADRLKKEYGVGAVCVQADVSKYENCEKIINAGIEAFGDKIAVLINNAGIQSNKPFQDITPEEYTRLISIELLGTMHCTRIALPYMQKEKDGCIINISSVCGIYGQVGQADYSAAKSGMFGFTKAIANENAEIGVRANCIAPGLIRTDMVNGLPEEQVELFAQGIPMKRLGEPEEIAECMSYIVNARYLTGQTISPNGGLVMP